ncbi:2-isopropylmalate synthase [Enterobacter roggenkampii]|nr:2-isopropylmalate synthase [Enterobacter roggenkampii]
MNYSNKYKPYPLIYLPDRTWPDKRLQAEPIWCSVDLRDGNQALPDPMDHERKLKLFNCLLDIGFKEIEVGFPSASENDFYFVRYLIENGLIPDDTLIQVLVPCRKELIHSTIESLKGVNKAIVHLYNSTSIQQREQVFCKSKDEIIDIALSGVQWIVDEIKHYPNTEWILEYSPESFTGTELEFALEICNAVIDKWTSVTKNNIIINLPSTVELSTPNIYADQIEWMSRNLKYRDKVCLSVHPHNDRGTAIASAELALLAGADRIEGTLFGNGERTGNVDLVNIALNLVVQGVDVALDFTNIPAIVESVETCNLMKIPVRHPYAGDLVFTAFSGSHQDAINKSLVLQRTKSYWDVPYLPIDPSDIGRSYEEIIRINGQSGKGGVGYLLEQFFGIKLPRNLLIKLQQSVQKVADETSKEIDKDTIYSIFKEEFVNENGVLRFIRVENISMIDSLTKLSLALRFNSCIQTIHGEGNGILDAVIKSIEKLLEKNIEIVDYSENAMTQSSKSEAISFLTIKIDGETSYGVGLNTNIAISPVVALVSAINSHYSSKYSTDG